MSDQNLSRSQRRVAAVVPRLGWVVRKLRCLQPFGPVLREFKFVFDEQNSAYPDDLVF